MSAYKEFSDKKAFNYLQADAKRWSSKAEELLIAAYKLESSRDPDNNNVINRSFRNVYYMLIGFTLEGYYKSAIIAKLSKEKGVIKPNKLDPRIQKHELEALAPDAGINLFGKQREVLIYLTECIKWRGRYPTPTVASAIDGSIECYSPNNDDKFFLTTLEPIITIDEVHGLIEEARNQI